MPLKVHGLALPANMLVFYYFGFVVSLDADIIKQYSYHSVAAYSFNHFIGENEKLFYKKN